MEKPSDMVCNLPSKMVVVSSQDSLKVVVFLGEQQDQQLHDMMLMMDPFQALPPLIYSTGVHKEQNRTNDLYSFSS